MIKIKGASLDISAMNNEYTPNSLERQILNKMSSSSWEYRYNDSRQLKFELDLRGNIVNAARALNGSRIRFRVFHQSRCNLRYWDRTSNGGFRLKAGVKPSAAINDIFINGSQYGTECATAMMIVFYKALLNVCKSDAFDKLFPQINLMNWNITEPLLKEAGIVKKAADVLPGDRGYFFNPDVSPADPEYRGENVIILPGGMYYGHGIGIATSQKIIRNLNSYRRRNASRSAYLSDSVSRLNFKRLADSYFRLTGS